MNDLLVEADRKNEVSLESLRERFPDYAKDIKINLSTIMSEEGAPDLSASQISGIALAAAYATRNQVLIAAIEGEVKVSTSKEVKRAAQAAASVMAMNNVYYRFIHLLRDDEISKMPAKLRMSIIGNPGIAKVDFELMSLAVSVLNGCGMCIEAHARQLAEHGVSKLAIQSTARIAAVINAAAQVISNFT